MWLVLYFTFAVRYDMQIDSREEVVLRKWNKGRSCR